MLKVIFTPRLNLFDAFLLTIAGSLIAEGFVWIAVVLGFIGFFFSVKIEQHISEQEDNNDG